MKSIIISNCRKYKTYNLTNFENNQNLLLIGDKGTTLKQHKLNSHKLVIDTYTLGKELVNTITKELTTFSSDKTRYMKFNDSNDDTIKDNIRSYSANFKTIKAKNYSHYGSAYDFYDIVHKTLSKKNIITFKDVPSGILISNFIGESKMIHLEFLSAEETDNEKKLNDYYNKLFTILEKHIDDISSSELNLIHKKMFFIPLGIKHFYNEIMNISSSSNESAKKIFEVLLNWINKYGFPHYTDRKKLHSILKSKLNSSADFYEDNNINNSSISIKSEYEFFNDAVPIKDFIFISILIYVLQELYEAHYKNKYISHNPEENSEHINNLSNILYYLGLPAEDQFDRSNINNIIEKSYHYHNHIMNHCNSILDFKLEHSIKKVYIKKRLISQYEFESTIVAAWYEFYNNYFGNTELKNGILYCFRCDDIIPVKPHVTREGIKLCDNCYEEHKKQKNSKRVAAHRKKE